MSSPDFRTWACQIPGKGGKDSGYVEWDKNRAQSKQNKPGLTESSSMIAAESKKSGRSSARSRRFRDGGCNTRELEQHRAQGALPSRREPCWPQGALPGYRATCACPHLPSQCHKTSGAKVGPDSGQHSLNSLLLKEWGKS